MFQFSGRLLKNICRCLLDSNTVALCGKICYSHVTKRILKIFLTHFTKNPVSLKIKCGSQHSLNRNPQFESMKIILFASSESNVLIVLIHREPVFLQRMLDLRIKSVLVVHGSVIT